MIEKSYGGKAKAGIIIPAYNEEKTIVKVIDKTQKVFSSIKKPIEIVIINDASTDSTRELCEKAATKYKNITIINNKKNQGKTKSIIKVVPFIKADILAFIDGDNQYDPSDLPLVIKKIEEGYDICSGIRKRREDSLYRRFMSKSFNLFDYILFNIQVQDINCGLKAFKKELIEKMPINSLNAKWFIDTELLAKAYHQNLKVTEVPIKHYSRSEGKSKVKCHKLALETIIYGILLKFRLLKEKFSR